MNKMAKTLCFLCAGSEETLHRSHQGEHRRRPRYGSETNHLFPTGWTHFNTIQPLKIYFLKVSASADSLNCFFVTVSSTLQQNVSKAEIFCLTMATILRFWLFVRTPNSWKTTSFQTTPRRGRGEFSTPAEATV